MKDSQQLVPGGMGLGADDGKLLVEQVVEHPVELMVEQVVHRIVFQFYHQICILVFSKVYCRFSCFLLIFYFLIHRYGTLVFP